MKGRSPAAIRLARLHAQCLVRPADSPADVVRNLLAVQAQDYPAALWAIGSRCARPGRAGVEQAIADRQIVRSWPMRGTLHFVAAADLRWMITLLAPRVIARTHPRRRQLGLTEADIDRCAALLARELDQARPATRTEIYQMLCRHGISTDGQRGIHILLRLCQEGLLCQGPYRARQPTFTLLEQWLGPARAPGPDEAAATLARRYFSGHGPATVADLAWWSGLTLTAARGAVAGAAAQLEELCVGDATYYYVPGADTAGPASARGAASVGLLAGFDEYLLGYQDRTLALTPEWAQRIVPGGNGIFLPALLVGGRIVGTWRRAEQRDTVRITVQPFEPLSPASSRSVSIAARRYGRFVELPVDLAIDSAVITGR